MAFRLPPLNSLRLFEAAGRHLSFKLAADELGLTPSAVSHGIQGLEDWLGTPLFLRGRAGLTLTEVGVAYHPAVREALVRIATASEHCSRRGQRNEIRVSAAPTFAARLLLPRLDRFREREPDVSVVVDMVHQQIDLPRDGVDLAIRLGTGDWPGLTAERLLTEELLPLGAPTLRASYGKRADLRKMPLIHIRTVSDDWERWFAATGAGEVDLSGGLRVDTVQMAAEAAVAGRGLVLGRRPLMDSELEAGSLVPFAEQSLPSRTSYWLVGLPETMVRPEIRAFGDWLKSELGAMAANAQLQPAQRAQSEIPSP